MPSRREVTLLAFQEDNTQDVTLTQDNGTWVECNPPAPVKPWNQCVNPYFVELI